MPICSAPRALVAVVFLAAWMAALAGPARADRSFREEVLDSKYRRGDYSFYVSWYDPWGRAFDEHGKFAWPVGGKVRFRLGPRYRVEGDFSYYRKSGQPRSFISTAITPGFDGVMVGVTLQAVLMKGSRVQPYVGAGPMFVSLANDFAAEIRGVPSDILDRFVFASWSELDLGVQGVIGLDFPLGGRAFPFVEYRQLVGGFQADDITVGFVSFDADQLRLLDGSDVPDEHDWTGPNILAGLKVRF